MNIYGKEIAEIEDDNIELDRATDMLFNAVSSLKMFIECTINQMDRPYLENIIGRIEGLGFELDCYDPDNDCGQHDMKSIENKISNLNFKETLGTPTSKAIGNYPVGIPSEKVLDLCYCKPGKDGKIVHTQVCNEINQN